MGCHLGELRLPLGRSLRLGDGILEIKKALGIEH